jgi:hypothetical protein
MHVTGADIHDQQAVQPLHGHCAVDVKEVRSEHRRGLSVQELPPCRVGAPLGVGGIQRTRIIMMP